MEKKKALCKVVSARISEVHYQGLLRRGVNGWASGKGEAHSFFLRYDLALLGNHLVVINWGTNRKVYWFLL